MIRFARSFVRSRASAEEVVQETWLAVLDGLHRFEARSSLMTWIYRILVNKARTRGVRDARTVTFSEAVGDGGDPAAVDAHRFDAAGMWCDPPRSWDALDPERIVAGRQLWSQVVEILDDLPPLQKAVITLHDVEGLDPAGICDVLGLTDGNRRVLLHRARAKVRQSLELLLGSPAT